MKCNKKDIIIISHFVDFPWEKGNDRFLYIADMLVSQGAEVEVVILILFIFKKNIENWKECWQKR
ncbi:MAG: hypothetical protein ACLS8T_35980 [Anaerobutyricum sp.]